MPEDQLKRHELKFSKDRNDYKRFISQKNPKLTPALFKNLVRWGRVGLTYGRMKGTGCMANENGKATCTDDANRRSAKSRRPRSAKVLIRMAGHRRFAGLPVNAPERSTIGGPHSHFPRRGRI